MSRLLIILFISFATSSLAQKNVLTIEGTAPDLFISHKVNSGESLSGLARKYNQSQQAIATANAFPIDKGLQIGQTIKIPLTEKNLVTNSHAEEGETLVPLYHIVGKSETLFRIGNNLSAAITDVRKWNNLSDDKIALGAPLIVGHLKMTNKGAAQKSSLPTIAEEQVAKTAPSAISQKALNNKAEPVKEQKAEPAVATGSKPEAMETKKEEPVVAVSTVQEKKEVIPPSSEEKKTENLGATPAPAVQAHEPAIVDNTTFQQPSIQPTQESGIDLLAPVPETSNEGVFAALYTTSVLEKSVTNKLGDAATFKSTSGWQDKKYYVLMNDVAAGTILKIASADNKVIFAKVLGNMPEMKENKGLMLRLSNAAASYLGMVDSKFSVQVTFYQ